ncbi:SgcJ/EcaC family oxidoreductase [Guyparkeria hydrothermalis]|uniref:SgcJ/EcaC family oxidoreductase n=1 Tax=Guyparkeria hydrothermalis TaxID=923 RepID=UPI00201FC301|nr:SgcJ/EcaC family oxidoreductase [Guyparkeria hydrothermalis]
MTQSNRPRISGTQFINADAAPRERLSMGASHRDPYQPVTGTGADAPIDVPANESCTVCAPATRQLAKDLFERWNDALQTGDAREVTKLYAEDGVLLPTVSNVPRTNHAEIQDYFEHFLEKKPVGTINTRNVKIGCNKLTDAGTYTFRVTDEEGSKDVAARYTFVYEKRGDDWLIVHHHSSMMPTA